MPCPLTPCSKAYFIPKVLPSSLEEGNESRPNASESREKGEFDLFKTPPAQACCLSHPRRSYYSVGAGSPCTPPSSRYAGVHLPLAGEEYFYL